MWIVDIQKQNEMKNSHLIDSRLIWSIGSFFYVKFRAESLWYLAFVWLTNLFIPFYLVLFVLRLLKHKMEFKLNKMKRKKNVSVWMQLNCGDMNAECI